MALEEHAELVVKTKSGESYTIAESRIVKGSLTASSSLPAPAILALRQLRFVRRPG